MEIIDTVGGVDVHVAKNFFCLCIRWGQTEDPFPGRNPAPKWAEALAFVRYRSEAQGIFSEWDSSWN